MSALLGVSLVPAPSLETTHRERWAQQRVACTLKDKAHFPALLYGGRGGGWLSQHCILCQPCTKLIARRAHNKAITRYSALSQKWKISPNSLGRLSQHHIWPAWEAQADICLLWAECTAGLYMSKEEAWFCGSPQTRCSLNLAELSWEQGQGNFRLTFTEHPQN